MKSKLGLGALLLFVGLTQACAAETTSEATAGTSADEIRAISAEEALADLETVGQSLRLEYGPLDYKHERFGFDLDAELTAARAKIVAAKTEADRIRPFYELLGKLRDGHVSISFRVRGDESAENALQLYLTPIEGAYFARWPAADDAIQAGDKVVSIDGLSTKRIEELLYPLNQIGTHASTLHRVGLQMTQRPFYAPAELAPRGTTAHVVVEHADGSQAEVDLPWTARRGTTGQIVSLPLAAAPGIADPAFSPHLGHLVQAGPDAPLATIFERGQTAAPFFLTPQVRKALGVTEASPKVETLNALGVFPSTPAADANRFAIRGYTYRANDKNVLLVRIPAFTVPLNNMEENVAWLAALLQDHLESADVAIVDVTHNPGGSVPYVQGLASLFTTKPVAGFVQASRASRSQVAGLLQSASMSTAAQPIWRQRLEAAERAFDNGELLAPFAPMSGRFLGPRFPFTGVEQAGTEMLAPHPSVQWNKPVLVLHDELSGSGGDALPMILQRAGVKTFGATTAGMGGSVSSSMLPHTGAMFSFTRGLFAAYEPDPARVQLIENNGVSPDYPHAITAADFRAGYVEYANAFTDIATSLP